MIVCIIEMVAGTRTYHIMFPRIKRGNLGNTINGKISPKIITRELDNKNPQRLLLSRHAAIRGRE